MPFVSTRHNDDRYLLGPFRYVDRAFARRARRLIAISDAVRLFLERAGHDPRKLITIRYGLDELPPAPSSPTPAEAGIPADAPLALAVGRLIEQKDHETLLLAFARVRAEHPDARLAILGGGPLEAETRALAESLGIGDAVSLPGRTEIRDWLERADVFVHTSRWEGFGIVLLEAMLAGLPDRRDGVSAPSRRSSRTATPARSSRPGTSTASPRELAALLADPGLRRQLGEAGRERARTEFSVARMAERTIEVYEESGSGAAVVRPPRSVRASTSRSPSSRP